MPSDPSGGPSANDETIRSLREALALSPDNAPLRTHLAWTLLRRGHADEAETEFRLVLKRSPEHLDAKLGLARAFEKQAKRSHALALVEDIVKHEGAPAAAYLLHARLLEGIGEVQQAVREYRQAMELDRSLADSDFAKRLGIDSDPERDEVVEGQVRAAWEDSEASGSEVTIERPELHFGDVGGMDELKEQIRLKIIHPLTHPEIYKAYGKPVGGGILLYGPPGCGKTYLARATAGEIHAGFLSVGINDVLDMWIGNSERNLHDVFEHARAHRPCVLFFDEVDALGANRGDMRQHAGRQLINQFLAEMDGVQASNEGVLILAATNAPWHLDPAFRRPGRFDRVLFVPPPDASARETILELHCRNKPTEEIDFRSLARKSDQFSGADLKGVVDVAIEGKLQDALKQGTPQPLCTRDLAKAMKGCRPTTREWFATARNYALYSNQGGMYDDILSYMKLK